jgi:hypothetical protein
MLRAKIGKKEDIHDMMNSPTWGSVKLLGLGIELRALEILTEPTTLRLRVSRATDCASRACYCLMKRRRLVITIMPITRLLSYRKGNNKSLLSRCEEVKGCRSLVGSMDRGGTRRSSLEQARTLYSKPARVGRDACELKVDVLEMHKIEGTSDMEE